MVKTKLRIAQTINALCDELYWSIRSFYAAKAIFETEIRLTPTLFDTFYFSCLDEAALILSRMLIAKEDAKNDEAINLQYIANLASNNPSTFQYANPDDVKILVERQAQLFELYKPLITILRGQRDQNLAHLDRRHVNDPDWRENQTQLNLSEVEKLYQELIDLLAIYYRLFYGTEFRVVNWDDIAKTEVKDLIQYV